MHSCWKAADQKKKMIKMKETYNQNLLHSNVPMLHELQWQGWCRVEDGCCCCWNCLPFEIDETAASAKTSERMTMTIRFAWCRVCVFGRLLVRERRSVCFSKRDEVSPIARIHSCSCCQWNEYQDVTDSTMKMLQVTAEIHCNPLPSSRRPSTSLRQLTSFPSACISVSFSFNCSIPPNRTCDCKIGRAHV